MNHTTIVIRFILAAALAISMIVAGTTLSTLQLHGYAATQTKKLFS
jgi:hypothetical protein